MSLRSSASGSAAHARNVATSCGRDRRYRRAVQAGGSGRTKQTEQRRGKQGACASVGACLHTVHSVPTAYAERRKGQEKDDTPPAIALPTLHCASRRPLVAPGPVVPSPPPPTHTPTHLGLLRLGGGGAVVVLDATIVEHLGHGDGAAGEVGVVVQALAH